MYKHLPYSLKTTDPAALLFFFLLAWILQSNWLTGQGAIDKFGPGHGSEK